MFGMLGFSCLFVYSILIGYFGALNIEVATKSKFLSQAQLKLCIDPFLYSSLFLTINFLVYLFFFTHFFFHFCNSVHCSISYCITFPLVKLSEFFLSDMNNLNCNVYKDKVRYLTHEAARAHYFVVFSLTANCKTFKIFSLLYLLISFHYIDC